MKRTALSACPQAERFKGNVPLTGFGLGTGRNIKVKRAFCLFFLACCLLWAAPQTVRAAETSIGEHFVGETLVYDAGFLWFDKAVHCVVNLQRGEKPGEYVAVLWGQTRGFIGWLSSYRERLFISYLQEVDGGRRFRPLHFEKRITSGSRKYREEHDFDYPQGRWQIKTYKNQRLAGKEERKLPAGKGFEDILSSFYNFRYGVYGPIVKGGRYTLPAFSRRQGSISYQVRILRQGEQNRHKLLEETDSAQDYLVHIKLDKEIFGTKEGILWVWLSPRFVPRRGVAEDAIELATDIYGKRKWPKPSQKKSKSALPPFLKFKSLFPQGLQ